MADLLAAHDISPEEAVFVGDSLSDGDFARTAGVRFVGLQRVFSDAEFRARGLNSAADLETLTRLWSSGQAFGPATSPAVGRRPPSRPIPRPEVTRPGTVLAQTLPTHARGASAMASQAALSPRAGRGVGARLGRSRVPLGRSEGPR